MLLRRLPSVGAAAVALTALLVSPASVQGTDFVSWEASIGANYTNNLLSEASGVDDSYTNTRVAAHWYLHRSVRASLSGDYTYYGNTYDLSNLSGVGSFSWIPTAASSRFTWFNEFSFDTRSYRERFSEFDNRNTRVKMGAGYEISPRLRVRGGLFGRVTIYPDVDTTTDADYRQVELFVGLNLSLPLNTSLDVESGMAITGYSYIDASRDSVFAQFSNPADYLTEGDFRSFHISPRLSHAIGSRTGISLTYTYRNFDNTESSVVPGYTTDFLSPWAAFFEGSSIALQVKTFVVPGLTVTGGMGYWDKTYLRTLELVSEWIQPFPGAPLTEITRYEDPREADAREDALTRFFLSVHRSFSLLSLVFEPGLSLEYSDNRSTDDDYEYTSTAVGVTLNLHP